MSDAVKTYLRNLVAYALLFGAVLAFWGILIVGVFRLW